MCVASLYFFAEAHQSVAQLSLRFAPVIFRSATLYVEPWFVSSNAGVQVRWVQWVWCVLRGRGQSWEGQKPPQESQRKNEVRLRGRAATVECHMWIIISMATNNKALPTNRPEIDYNHSGQLLQVWAPTHQCMSAMFLCHCTRLWMPT